MSSVGPLKPTPKHEIDPLFSVTYVTECVKNDLGMPSLQCSDIAYLHLHTQNLTPSCIWHLKNTANFSYRVDYFLGHVAAYRLYSVVRYGRFVNVESQSVEGRSRDLDSNL
jgi:hypothetical protein